MSQALTEMANIGETVEYSAGALRVTDGRALAAGAGHVADSGAVAVAPRAGARVAVDVVVGVDVVVSSRACRCIGVGVRWWCCLQAVVVVEVLVPVPVHGLV